MQFALNHMTTPQLAFADFVALSSRLGCVGIEARNDIARPLFDGMSAADAGKLVSDSGLRLVGLSQVYPFNTWDAEREAAVRSLIDMAKQAGAETISLIPRNDGTGLADGERQQNVRVAMKAILPMLQDADIVALVEPLGFLRSSLRSKAELVDVIADLDCAAQFKLVHDTFHHTLADGGPIFPEHTGIVHISGVVDPSLAVDQMEDEHRVLIDQNDRLGNIDQIQALIEAGYNGLISYECFSPETHAMKDPYSEIKRSFEFMTNRLGRQAAVRVARHKGRKV